VKRGFTLIECLIASGVVILVFSFSAALFALSGRVIDRTCQTMSSVYLAQAKMENLRAWPFDTLISLNDDDVKITGVTDDLILIEIKEPGIFVLRSRY